MTVTIEKAGRRHYIVGNTYAIKDRLRDAGCKWDAERRQWWTGKADVAEQFVGVDTNVKPTKEQMAKKPLIGKVSYKGRTYFALAYSHKTNRYWLTVLDCSIDFWADGSQCRVVKQYSSDYDQTLAGIRRFIERQKSAKAGGFEDASHERAVNSGRCRAPGCSAYPDGQAGYCKSCAFDEFDC